MSSGAFKGAASGGKHIGRNAAGARASWAEECEKSVETLLTILDNLDAHVYVADMDSYEILFMNRQMQSDFGGDFSGRICWKSFRRLSAPCPHCTNRQLVDDHGRPRGMVVWEDKNPLTGRWYTNRDRAIVWTDGRVVRLQIATDITRLKEAEEALRESEEKYRDLIENAPIGIFQTTASGALLDLNPCMARMTGYESPASVKRSLTDLANQIYVQPDLRREFLNRLRSEGQVDNFEYQIKRRDGSTIWLSENARIGGRTPDGDLIINGFATDITARKRSDEERNKALQALQKSEERYRAIFENTGTLTIIFDETCTILMVNRESDEVLGLGREEIEGRRKWTEFVPPEDLETMLEYHRRRLEAPEDIPRKYTGRILTQDGRIRHMLISVDIIPGTNHRIASLLDMTEQYELEEQLRQAQKMEAVGTLAGGIAHEFNNLLHGLAGNLELLQGEISSNHPAISRCQDMLRMTSRGREIVSHLLTFSRKDSYSFVPTDLNQIVTETLSLVRRTTPRSISLETRLDQGLPRISADRTQLEQVLLNLINNAVDVIDPVQGGCIRLETCRRHGQSEAVSGQEQPGAAQYAVLRVQDSGPGMTEKVREQIFDPFFTTKEVSKGTGLGLAIVFGIVQGHGGSISVKSLEPSGTTFEILLPAIGGRQLDEQEGAESAQTARQPRSSRQETILLVDDEQFNLDIAREVLEENAYTVLTASCGQEALDIFKNSHESIDAVLLDLGLPGLSGERCLQEMQAIDPEVAVLVTTGYTSHEILGRPQAFGATGVLRKPFGIGELLHSVRQLLDSRDSR